MTKKDKMIVVIGAIVAGVAYYSLFTGFTIITIAGAVTLLVIGLYLT